MIGVSGRFVCVCVVLFVAAVGAAPTSWKWQESRGIFSGDREWCDPVLGCLNITDDWRDWTRPINQLPYTRERINTTFTLQTRANRATDGKDVFIVAQDASTIAASTFDPTKPIKFIIHGFIDTGNTYWLKEMAEAFLDHGDYNVFRVNWGQASLCLFSQAAANARVVGLEIGYLANWLIAEYGVNPVNIHLVGHSLGGHLAGYAGEQIKGLGRISGLDPAGIYFENMPPIVRLDETDALFVDVIHTDADSIFLLGYGSDTAMGNIDFYPNSGHDQPGCDPATIAINLITEHDIGAIRDIAVCSHCRPIFLFIDSLNERECDFVGHECSDYESFISGKCNACGHDGTQCAVMGIRAVDYKAKERINVHLYLDTDEAVPFCYYHYSISLMTARPDGAEDFVVGHLTASFYDNFGQVIRKERISPDHLRIDHGAVTHIMFKSHTKLSTIMRTDLRWDYDNVVSKPGTYCFRWNCNRSLYIKSIRITPINFKRDSVLLWHTRTFCEEEGVDFEVKDGKTVSITYSDKCAAIL